MNRGELILWSSFLSHAEEDLYQMTLKLSVFIEQDEEGYYIATVPALPGCHTQAKSLDELLKRIKEAIELYLEEETDIDMQKLEKFVGVQVVELETG